MPRDYWYYEGIRIKGRQEALRSAREFELWDFDRRHPDTSDHYPDCRHITIEQQIALTTLVNRHADNTEYVLRLREALRHDRPDFSFMLGLYPGIFRLSQKDDLDNVAVCSQVIGVTAVNTLVSVVSDETQPANGRDSAYQSLVSLIIRSTADDRTTWLITEEIVRRLLDELTTDDGFRIKEVKSALVMLGASAVKQLLCQVKGKDLHRRRHAAEILGQMGAAACPAIPTLEEAAKGRDDVLQTKAKAALAKIRKAAAKGQ